MQRSGPDRLRPAQQRRRIWHWLERGPAEPAQHETVVGDTGLGPTFVPVIAVLDGQESRQHFHRYGMAPVNADLRIAGRNINAHLILQEILVEEAVESLEDGISQSGECRNASENVFVGIAIDQHPRHPAR